MIAYSEGIGCMDVIFVNPRRIVEDHRRETTLNHVYWDVEGFAKRLDFWFATPDSSISNRHAVLFKILLAHHPRFVCACRIFPSNGWKEWYEVVGMLVHICGRDTSDGGVGCVCRCYNTVNCELICYSREQTMSVWIDLNRQIRRGLHDFIGTNFVYFHAEQVARL